MASDEEDTAPGPGAAAHAPPSGRRVSCVLPAYDEAESLPQTVSEWDAALGRLAADHEIIVVDDGSTDDTGLVLRDLAARFARVRVVTHPTNRGYGAALVDGFERAAFPLLFFTDADGQYDPDDLRPFLERIDTADLVVGYRRHRADPAARSLLSRGYNLITRRMLGTSLRDVNCAFKLMRRDAYRRLRLASPGFGINAELALDARRAALAIVELPVRHRPRRAGRSTVRPFHSLAALSALVQIRARRRPRALAADPAPIGDPAVESRRRGG
jgi:glycosyltransferase involved in cell wall biosynthesis